MVELMKAWSATGDDLIWLRRSLGIHAKEADIEHLPAEMVKAYQDTHYAKVRAAPGSLSCVFRQTVTGDLLVASCSCFCCVMFGQPLWRL